MKLFLVDDKFHHHFADPDFTAPNPSVAGDWLDVLDRLPCFLMLIKIGHRIQFNNIGVSCGSATTKQPEISGMPFLRLYSYFRQHSHEILSDLIVSFFTEPLRFFTFFSKTTRHRIAPTIIERFTAYDSSITTTEGIFDVARGASLFVSDMSIDVLFFSRYSFRTVVRQQFGLNVTIVHLYCIISYVHLI